MRNFLSILIGLSVVILPLAYGMAGGIFANEVVSCALLLFFVTIGLAILVYKIWRCDGFSRKVQISILDFFVICCLAYLVFNIVFIGEYQIDRYVYYEWGAAIAGYLLLRKRVLILSVLLYACCISGAVQSIIVICQRLGFISSNNVQFDVTGSLGNPGQIGGYIAICWVIALGLLWNILKNRKYMYGGFLLVSIIIQFYAIYLVYSRAAWVAVVFGIVGMLWFNSSKFSLYCRRYKIGITIIICFIVALGGIDTRIIYSFYIPFWSWRLFIILTIALGALAARDGLFIRRMSCSLLSLYQERKDIKEADYKRMKDNIYFNDYYMTWLTQQIELGVDSGIRIKDIQPSCEGYCTLGKYHIAHKEYSNAEYFLNKASFMIPTRIRPKYYLWELNIGKGDMNKAAEIAGNILTMPLKVENTFTLKVKRKMREYLTSLPAPGSPPPP